jgi:hypothetical protein
VKFFSSQQESSTWPGTGTVVLGALRFFLGTTLLGLSVFLLTTNMRLFLNLIINDIFSPILICEKPFL